MGGSSSSNGPAMTICGTRSSLVWENTASRERVAGMRRERLTAARVGRNGTQLPHIMSTMTEPSETAPPGGGRRW
jgi:hypothetical protein